MPRRPQFPSECDHCNRLADHIVRGRCNTCYSYFRKNGRERPLKLWNRVAVFWEPAQEGDVCDCGEVAVARLSVPISEGSRGMLFLCEGCGELERALSPSSSWSAD